VVPVQAPTFEALGWEAEVEVILRRICPTTESYAAVEAIAKAVRQTLRSALPEAEVAGFACGNPLSGTAFGVAVPEVDIVLNLSPKYMGGGNKNMDVGKLQKSLIRTCTDKLVGSGAFKFRRSAFRGSEPKVTLIAPSVEGQASIPINLSVNATSPAHCALLFEGCGRLEPRAKDLILLVRRWAKDRAVSHAAKGHLSPYCWTLLAIYYLQVGLEDSGFRLPSLAALTKSGQLPKATEPTCSKTAAELFKGFLEFYTQRFDWRNEAVSVRLGQRAPPMVSLPLHVLLHADGKTTQVGPSIEDPFEGSTNLGECMNWLSLGRLREELSRGHELCTKGASLAVLLEPWSPPEGTQPEQDQEQ